ncbi:hypothetical protein PVAP13_3KG402318 [Panicum virgatum]|uniref:VWFA domain-containing protein n=1 Tax=Panicum virgatum TaxID=38727 RepID=A0A8T0V6S8_PANVG|nr:hypothetical protein PVAP13_3KG402318 [Panicum virgatum]
MQVKMASEKVRVNAAMNPPILLVDYSHRARLNGTAVVRVQAPSSMKSNGSIDIVTLLDVSHSISWMASSSDETPSKMDLLKNALKFIISQLDDNDRLAIVAFNDQVIKEHTTGILEISGGGRMAIEKKVDGLVTQGDTAFKPSLEHAVKLLDDRADKTRAGCIVLISDGVDKSQFMWSHESLAPTDPIRGLLRKYPVHTLGLFKADPKALHYIAKESYGTYSSITDNKDLDKNIMEALAVCLAGLKTIVAFDTCVDITSSSLEITRVDSGGYTRRAAPGSGISIGMLCAGEVKDLVVYFSYTTGSWERGYYTTLSGITARVTYKDMPGGQASTSTNNCSVSVAVHTTQDGSLPANPCPPFPLVLQQMVRFKVVDLLIGILQELKALKKDAGGAKEKDGVDDPVLQSIAANMLQRKWMEFKQSDESWKAATPKSLLDLGSIDGDVNAMVGILRKGLGVGCIYSWLSSHEMQRATVTGLPAEAMFRTPVMEMMVQKVHRQLLLKEAYEQVAEDRAVYDGAIGLLDGINKRFQLWCKLDAEVPPAFQLDHQHQDDESRNLTDVLHGGISRARQHDIYLAAIHAIKQWQSSSTPERRRMATGRTSRRMHA